MREAIVSYLHSKKPLRGPASTQPTSSSGRTPMELDALQWNFKDEQGKGTENKQEARDIAGPPHSLRIPKKLELFYTEILFISLKYYF